MQVHTHTDGCYERVLICKEQEHTHTLSCYANPETLPAETAEPEVEETTGGTQPALAETPAQTLPAEELPGEPTSADLMAEGEPAAELQLGVQMDVEVAAEQMVKLPFTPELTHNYVFESKSGEDTYGYLYDANGIQLTSDDEGGNGHNFKVTYTLTAETPYYFGVKYYNASRFGTFPVLLSLGEHTSKKDDAGDLICNCWKKVLTSGTCGEDAWWSFDDGVLTISGTDAMGNYNDQTVPWHIFLEEIKSVVIERGMTSIGYGAFQDCRSLTSVVIPESVTSTRK